MFAGRLVYYALLVATMCLLLCSLAAWSFVTGDWAWVRGPDAEWRLFSMASVVLPVGLLALGALYVVFSLGVIAYERVRDWFERRSR